MSTNIDLITELLTPNEVGKTLRISKAGVYRLIERRRIRFYRVMGSIRFAKGDIVSFLENNQVEQVDHYSNDITKN